MSGNASPKGRGRPCLQRLKGTGWMELFEEARHRRECVDGFRFALPILPTMHVVNSPPAVTREPLPVRVLEHDGFMDAHMR
jgi:hypothetical protein